MKRILQINTTANSGSHGRIASGLGDMLIDKGYESYLAYGRTATKCSSVMIKIGSRFDMALHLVSTRLFDRHGFGSINATKSFVKEIDKIDPDIIHLHNLHGYYLNIKVLFEYLRNLDKPVVWTFHDCWPFTGHCGYFDAVNCKRWMTECHHCPNKQGYPRSWLLDNSKRNFHEKKELFIGIDQMILVSPSKWMAGHLKNSFLSDSEIKVINNGVDLENFKPALFQEAIQKYGIQAKYIVGVASIWSERKGLKDFLALRKTLAPEIEIVLVGLTHYQQKLLPDGIRGILRTENIRELAALYSGAEVFVNPTYVDNFPTVNLEALACGTPVVTYKTGGSPEAVDDNTGIIVEKGNISDLNKAISVIMHSENKYSAEQCRARAEKHFSSIERCLDYLKLYEEVLDRYK